MIESDISRFRSEKATDGVTVLVDPGKKKKKKNRHRHVKDGAPKNMRGKEKPDVFRRS